jgi:hypothetical protein
LKTFLNIQETIEDIKRKFPVNPSQKDWKQTGELQIRCPSCSDKKYHLGLSFTKNAYNCFRCPFSGKLVDFLKFYKIKHTIKDQISTPEIKTEALKLKFPKDFNRNYDIINKSKEYLVNRGFDLNFIYKDFKVWPITDKDNYYYGYLIFYINDYAFYARRFLDTEDKKLKHFIKKSDPNMKLFYVYGKNNSKTILVVESMLNLIKAAQFGYNAVCIFGKSKWSGLIEYLKNNKTDYDLCLAFDKDVKITEIEKFINKFQKNYRYNNLFYIDPENMPCNDIAEINDKNLFINTITKRKTADSLFLNNFSLKEIL